jgi:hypothetical protein
VAIKHADDAVYYVKPVEMATLLVNLHLAAQHPLVGHGDHVQSLRDITNSMNIGTVKIRKNTLESALWACNMMEELGEFWAPFIEPTRIKNYSEFQRFLDGVHGRLPYGYKFDRFYNTIEDKRRIR